MPYVNVLYIKKDHVAYVTLNRPEAKNIINQQLAQELGDVCRQIKQDADIYVVVITGRGDVFCRGSEQEQSTTKPNSLSVRYNVTAAIASIDQPVIAAINGDALGEGLELALGCDIRIASSQARFGLPQVALGFIPADGATQRLPRIVGKGKALELILAAETIGADEALRIGLVSKIVDKKGLAAEAEALAQTMAGKAPLLEVHKRSNK